MSGVVRATNLPKILPVLALEVSQPGNPLSSGRSEMVGHPEGMSQLRKKLRGGKSVSLLEVVSHGG